MYEDEINKIQSMENPIRQGIQGFFNNKLQGKKRGVIGTYRLKESKRHYQLIALYKSS